MTRKFNLFVIAAFLGVQLLSFLHFAQYGVDKHEHNGQVCGVYLHYQHTPYSTPGEAVALPALTYTAIIFTVAAPRFIQVDNHQAAFPRAPPLFS